MSIIEFTTLTGREKNRVLLGSSIKGVFAEIYLDELARVLDTAMKLKPNLDFHVLVEIYLNPTILHEILHYYGAEQHSFTDRVLKWLREEL